MEQMTDEDIYVLPWFVDGDGKLRRIRASCVSGELIYELEAQEDDELEGGE